MFFLIHPKCYPEYILHTDAETFCFTIKFKFYCKLIRFVDSLQIRWCKKKKSKIKKFLHHNWLYKLKQLPFYNWLYKLKQFSFYNSFYYKPKSSILNFSLIVSTWHSSAPWVLLTSVDWSFKTKRWRGNRLVVTREYLREQTLRDEYSLAGE